MCGYSISLRFMHNTFHRQYFYVCRLHHSLRIPFTHPPLIYAIGLECIDIDGAAAVAVAVATVAADELLLCLESLNWTPHSILHRDVYGYGVCVHEKNRYVKTISVCFFSVFLLKCHTCIVCVCVGINGMNQLTPSLTHSHCARWLRIEHISHTVISSTQHNHPRQLWA